MIDFNINENGELIYNSNNQDAEYVSDDSLVRQIAINRIKSIVGDWFNSTIGANLEEFLGMPNNSKTSNEIINRIKTSLIYDDFLLESDLYFIPIIDKTTLSLKVFIKSKHNGSPILIDVEIDIVSGVKISNDFD